MTNSYNSEASKSKLVVRNTVAELDPENGGTGNTTLPGAKYSIADNTILYATQPDGVCVRCLGATAYRRSQQLLEEIADGTVLLPADDAEDRLLVMQEQLYQLLKENPELVTSSGSLQQFINNSQWSSLDYIYYAGKYMAMGDTAIVKMLLDTWPDQNNLDEAYQQYFTWLVQMYEDPNWSPDVNQVWQLANQCPVKYGTVVYAVRNLFNALTGEINSFESSCEGVSMQRGGQGKQFIRLKQPNKITAPLVANNLLVYPNPSNGVINIQYPRIKSIIVIDATGKVVKQIININNNIQQINLSGLSKGIYYLRILGETNKYESKKIILQ